MSGKSKYFIEIESASVREKGQSVCGDVCLQKRVGNRSLLVLSTGSGSGIRSNIVAGIIASMATEYSSSGITPEEGAKAILNTFPPDDFPDGRPACFTIVDILPNGRVKVADFGNSRMAVIRNGVEKRLSIEKIDVGGIMLNKAQFDALPEDRIILFSDGVTDSGKMSPRMPEGWGRKSVIAYCMQKIDEEKGISAHDLCREVVGRSEVNDLYKPKNDMTCAVVYFRKPRQILVCTGPPFNDHKDPILADMVKNFNGTKLICGGTTAGIVSRELKTPLNVILKRDPAALPPISRMEGVDLVTEGVMTLGKVKSMLDKYGSDTMPDQGTDAIVARMLLRHDVIRFVVGTRINPQHQDPNLPVELELRRNLVKDLVKILSGKFLKQVEVQYL